MSIARAVLRDPRTKTAQGTRHDEPGSVYVNDSVADNWDNMAVPESRLHSYLARESAAILLARLWEQALRRELLAIIQARRLVDFAELAAPDFIAESVPRH